MRGLIVLLLALTALSGCTNEDPVTDPGPADPLDTDPTQGNGTATPGTEDLVPALLVAAGNGTGNGTDANRTAPYNATFTLDADGFTDGTWALTDTVGGNTTELANGTTLPATVEATLDAGNHTLTLHVTAGNRTAETTLELAILPGQSAAAPDAATIHALGGTFAGGTADPIGNQGLTTVLEFEVPHDAAAVQVWVDWDDGTTGNTPLMTDLDLAFFDGAGKEVVAPGSGEFEYAYNEGSFAAGTWRAEVLPFYVPVDTTYSIEVVAWSVVPQQTTFEGGSMGGFELGTPADAAPDEHPLALPAGTQTVSARLAWTTEGLEACERDDSGLNDYDFDAVLGGKVRFGRGSLGSCEFGAVDAEGEDLGGDWSFVVHKFLTAPSDYTLTVFHA